jgi:hypothetical protein
VNHNLGHLHYLLEKKQGGLCGWSAHIITLAMIAYCGGKDFVFKEADCFWHGDVIGKMYQDLGNAKFVFGRKMKSPPNMSCSQSTFLVLHDFIPEFVSTYLALPDDIEMLPEDKFVTLERMQPFNYTRLSFGVDRERPIPFGDPIWFVQQVTEEELNKL